MKIIVPGLEKIFALAISTAIFYGVSMLNLPFSDPRYIQIQLQQDMTRAFDYLSLFHPKHITRYLLPLLTSMLIAFLLPSSNR